MKLSLFSLLFFALIIIMYAKKFTIQANYYGGGGYSTIFKLNLLYAIKSKIKEKFPKLFIKTKLRNMKVKKIYDKEIKKNYVLDYDDTDTSINHEEFNIFIQLKNEDKYLLIATSDPKIESKYEEYLQLGIGKDKKHLFVDKISNIIINKIKN
jgi:hypothetical protein